MLFYLPSKCSYFVAIVISYYKYFKSYYDKYFQKLHIANTAGATIKYTYNTTIMMHTI